MSNKFSSLTLKGTRIHTSPKGKIQVYKGEDGLYFLLLMSSSQATPPVIARGLINRKAAIQLANDKEYIY